MLLWRQDLTEVVQIGRFSDALRSWGSLVGYLMVQEFDQKFRASRLGALLAFAEPLLLILVILAIRGLFRGNLPAYGDSIAVFYSSGVFPFYVFVRLSVRTRRARYDASHRLPRVSSTDLLIASALAETAIILTTMMIWFAGMWVYGLHEAAPVSILECIIPIGLLLALGIGFGLMNSAISRRFPLWSYIYGRASRGLMVMSGVFYVNDLLPYYVRSVLSWNPLVHGIEWFRLGLYGSYPVHTLDRDYFMAWAGGMLFLGIILHRATLRTAKA